MLQRAGTYLQLTLQLFSKQKTDYKVCTSHFFQKDGKRTAPIRKKGRLPSRFKYQIRENKEIEMLMNESTKPNIAIGQERAEGGMRGEEKEKKKKLLVVFPFVYNRSSGKLLIWGYSLWIYGPNSLGNEKKKQRTFIKQKTTPPPPPPKKIKKYIECKERKT